MKPTPLLSVQPCARELHATYESQARLLWCRMNPRPRPCFTSGLLAECRALQRTLVREHQRDAGHTPVDYLVLSSAHPEVFNLGGDLGLFLRLIERREREHLWAYAQACIDVAYHQAVDLNLPLTTIALVQGDALGGGFEAALSCSVLIAERHAQFGLPEVMFDLFPGMGAYSFLSRRIGPHAAEQMILSGRLYSAEELHRLGVVDALAEPGCGEQVLRGLIAQRRRRPRAHAALRQLRQQGQTLEYCELLEIAELWVDTALGLSERELRTMQRLLRAQQRRCAGVRVGRAEQAVG